MPALCWSLELMYPAAGRVAQAGVFELLSGCHRAQCICRQQIDVSVGQC